MEKPAADCRTSTSTALKCEIIVQVARGLEAISDAGIVHRDIRARNCLVYDSGQNLTIKVSNFGLAFELNKDYSDVRMKRGLGRGQGPFEWMSPEAAYKQRYSKESDVWSYGVLCWEVYSCGEEPYNWLKEEFHHYMTNCIPLDMLPPKVMDTEAGVIPRFPHEVLFLLIECWIVNEEKRPSFQQIRNRLEGISSKYSANQLTNEIVRVRERRAGVAHNGFAEIVV